MIARVSQLSYSLEFRGHATRLEPGVLIMRASAPTELLEAGEALLEGRVSLVGDDAFEVVGSVSLGSGGALRFRSLSPGTISSAREPGLKLGTALCEIDGGSGGLTGASGRITSSFLLSETGELTDHQLGVIVVARDAITRSQSRTAL